MDRFKSLLVYCNTVLSGVARAIEIRVQDRTGGPAMSKVLSVRQLAGLSKNKLIQNYGNIAVRRRGHFLLVLTFQKLRLILPLLSLTNCCFIFNQAMIKKGLKHLSNN